MTNLNELIRFNFDLFKSYDKDQEAYVVDINDLDKDTHDEIAKIMFKEDVHIELLLDERMQELIDNKNLEDGYLYAMGRIVGEYLTRMNISYIGDITGDKIYNVFTEFLFLYDDAIKKDIDIRMQIHFDLLIEPLDNSFEYAYEDGYEAA